MCEPELEKILGKSIRSFDNPKFRGPGSELKEEKGGHKG
jgi:hypothetical protein